MMEYRISSKISHIYKSTANAENSTALLVWIIHGRVYFCGSWAEQCKWKVHFRVYVAKFVFFAVKWKISCLDTEYSVIVIHYSIFSFLISVLSRLMSFFIGLRIAKIIVSLCRLAWSKQFPTKKYLLRIS